MGAREQAGAELCRRGRYGRGGAIERGIDDGVSWSLLRYSGVDATAAEERVSREARRVRESNKGARTRLRRKAATGVGPVLWRQRRERQGRPGRRNASEVPLGRFRPGRRYRWEGRDVYAGRPLVRRPLRLDRDLQKLRGRRRRLGQEEWRYIP